MKAKETEAIRVLLKHLDGSQVLSEATLRQTLDTLAMWASGVTGAPVAYNREAALRTLSLVVTMGDEVPYATPMVSNFGGES